MKIVSFAQQKGGVGKSSAAINLACAAVASGRKVVLLDLDLGQATATKWAQRRNGAEPAVFSPKGGRVEEALAALKGVDLVVIDLPGRDAPIVGAGMKVSDLIIVPCRPLDIDIEASLTTVENAMRGKKRYAYLMNIAPPQVEKQRAKAYATQLREAGHTVAPTIIVQRIQVPDAIAQGSSAEESEPKGPSAQEFRELLAWVLKEVKGK